MFSLTGIFLVIFPVFPAHRVPCLERGRGRGQGAGRVRVGVGVGWGTFRGSRVGV